METSMATGQRGYLITKDDFLGALTKTLDDVQGYLSNPGVFMHGNPARQTVVKNLKGTVSKENELSEMDRLGKMEFDIGIDGYILMNGNRESLCGMSSLVQIAPNLKARKNEAMTLILSTLASKSNLLPFNGSSIKASLIGTTSTTITKASFTLIGSIKEKRYHHYIMTTPVEFITYFIRKLFHAIQRLQKITDSKFMGAGLAIAQDIISYKDNVRANEFAIVSFLLPHDKQYNYAR